MHFIAAEHESRGLDASTRGEPAGAAAPALPRFDRSAAHSPMSSTPFWPTNRRRLREGRRSAAGQSRVRRALGPALDGRLAVQRLGRLGPAGARQPAAYLALARLDRRVAQSRPAVRSHGRRDARGR